MSPKWMLTFPSVSIPDTTVSLCLMKDKDYFLVGFFGGRGGQNLGLRIYDKC